MEAGRPRLPEAHLGRIDEKGGGQGLGLAIAADIAEAAQGSLLLQNGAQGLVAVLDLPKAGAFERR